MTMLVHGDSLLSTNDVSSVLVIGAVDLLVNFLPVPVDWPGGHWSSYICDIICAVNEL